MYGEVAITGKDYASCAVLGTPEGLFNSAHADTAVLLVLPGVDIPIAPECEPRECLLTIAQIASQLREEWTNIAH